MSRRSIAFVKPNVTCVIICNNIGFLKLALELHWLVFQCRSVMTSYYHLLMKLSEGNVFSHVYLFTGVPNRATTHDGFGQSHGDPPSPPPLTIKGPPLFPTCSNLFNLDLTVQIPLFTCFILFTVLPVLSASGQLAFDLLLAIIRKQVWIRCECEFLNWLF